MAAGLGAVNTQVERGIGSRNPMELSKVPRHGTLIAICLDMA